MFNNCSAVSSKKMLISNTTLELFFQMSNRCFGVSMCFFYQKTRVSKVLYHNASNCSSGLAQKIITFRMPALFNSGQPFEMIFVTVFICIFFGVVWVILDSELRRCLREWVLMFSVRLSSLMLRTRIKEYNKGFILGSCSEMLDWPRPGRRRRCCWCCWRCSCLHDIVLCSRFWWNFLPSACSIISRWTVSHKIGGSFVRPSLGPSHLRHCPHMQTFRKMKLKLCKVRSLLIKINST